MPNITQIQAIPGYETLEPAQIAQILSAQPSRYSPMPYTAASLVADLAAKGVTDARIKVGAIRSALANAAVADPVFADVDSTLRGGGTIDMNSPAIRDTVAALGGAGLLIAIPQDPAPVTPEEVTATLEAHAAAEARQALIARVADASNAAAIAIDNGGDLEAARQAFIDALQIADIIL